MVIVRNNIRFVILLMVSSIVLSYIASLVDYDTALIAMQHAKISLVILAFILSLLTLLVVSLRWVYLLRTINVNFSIFWAYLSYLIGGFYGVVMPGTIGSDTFRVMVCKSRTNNSMSRILSSVIVERFLGVLALLLLVYVSWAFNQHVLYQFDFFVIPILIVTIATMALIVIWLFVDLSIIKKILSTLLQYHPKALDFINLALDSINAISKKHLLIAFGYSVIAHFVEILAVYALSQALSIDINLGVFLIIVPFVFLSSLLPISLGGMGLMEGILVFLLVKFGVTSSDAVLLAFLFLFNRLFVNMFGGIVQVFVKKQVGDLISSDVN